MESKQTNALPTIHTERLVINALSADDIKPFCAYRTAPEVQRYQGEFPRSEEDVQQLLDAQTEVPFGTANQWYQFAIRLQPENILVGDIAFHFNSPFIPQVEIGYSIMPDHQRKGYANESVQAVIDYCFSSMQIKIISAIIDVRNTASQHLLQKMGFQRMAYRPHACYLRGEWCDEADYALFLHKYQPLTSKISA